MNTLFKMERYQLFHNPIYWSTLVGVFILGFLTGETYLREPLGPGSGVSSALWDILDGMVYDSTFLLILLSSILALMLGQEFTWRTINMEICTGHSRSSVFAGKIWVYLCAFNLLMLVFPLGGCLREFSRFGLENAGVFTGHVLKAVFYSFLCNSICFMIPVFFCIVLRSMPKALGVTALVTFSMSMYLGYGMKLGLPLRFLPIFQIRNAVADPRFICGESVIVPLVWGIVLFFASWKVFQQCELK